MKKPHNYYPGSTDLVAKIPEPERRLKIDNRNFIQRLVNAPRKPDDYEMIQHDIQIKTAKAVGKEYIKNQVLAAKALNVQHRIQAEGEKVRQLQTLDEVVLSRDKATVENGSELYKCTKNAAELFPDDEVAAEWFSRCGQRVLSDVEIKLHQSATARYSVEAGLDDEEKN